MTGTAVRMACLALLALVVAGACARPGQLGHTDETPDPAATPAAAASADPAAEPPAAGVPGAPPASAAEAGSDARGRLDAPVEIRTPGPADVVVRTEPVAPGAGTGWISHPGPVISVVRSGTVVVVQRGACAPVTVGPGQGFFVADAVPYEMRNDGAEPAVLTRSELLAPGAEERRVVEPAC